MKIRNLKKIIYYFYPTNALQFNIYYEFKSKSKLLLFLNNNFNKCINGKILKRYKNCNITFLYQYGIVSYNKYNSKIKIVKTNVKFENQLKNIKIKKSNKLKF